MSVTAYPALITASCAAATNDRPAGNRRNSDVCDKNTRRGGRSLAITPQHPSTHPTRHTSSQADQLTWSRTLREGAGCTDEGIAQQDMHGDDQLVSRLSPGQPYELS